MSFTHTYTGVGVAERESRTSARRVATEMLVEGEPVAVDEFVARVLDRAHQAASGDGAPDEARVILGLAQSFADEFAKSNPRFDRGRFIHAAIKDPA